MTRKSKTRGRGQQSKGSNQGITMAKTRIPDSADAKKQRSINAIQGIIPLDLTIAPTLKTQQRSNSVNRERGTMDLSWGKIYWADMVNEEAIDSENKGTRSNSNSSPKSWSRVVGAIPSTEGLDLSKPVENHINVKITLYDIKGKVEYWSSAVVCYVLGSNPPQPVMDGYFRRIWGKLVIDKVAQISRGVFIVRFHDLEYRSRVVEEGVQMFDRKPVIVKP